MRLLTTVALTACLFFRAGIAAAAACSGHGVELQVLGSGGPELISNRASSSYLLWRDGRPSVLIDSGGGSALRFGESGAHVADLDLVLFTHLHADHSADFPALVKSSYFQDRSRPLPVLGPAGNAVFPSTTQFLRAFFDEKNGAFRYLSDFLPPAGRVIEGAYPLRPQNITLAPTVVKQVYAQDGLKVSAAKLIHGGVPALGWRVAIGDTVVAFSGDTNGDNGNLEKLADGATVLVAHNAVPEGVTGPVRALHMPPSVIGRIAASAKVQQLVLSHRMSRTLGREHDTQMEIEKNYAGTIRFADDLDCYSLAVEK